MQVILDFYDYAASWNLILISLLEFPSPFKKSRGIQIAMLSLLLNFHRFIFPVNK